MKQVFINLPVSNLKKSTEFYEALGFTKNPMFSDDNASCMQWSEHIVFMILTKTYFQTFLKHQSVIDAHTTAGALIALTLDSKEAVEKFAQTAKENGGDFYQSGPQMPEEMMFSREVTDPDGNILEAIWMNANFDPSQA